MDLFFEPVDTRLRVETTNHEHAVWITIHGEVDVASLEQLEAALAGVELDGTKSVHLHVSDLDFFDVAVLRRLTLFAQWVKQTGRDVTTCGATPMLHDVARVLGFHDDLGLH